MTVENSSTAPVILSVRDLDVKFNLRGRVLSAIRGISLDLYQGESLAIVGESGSGKSVFTKTFMGLLDQNGVISGGSILYNGQDLAAFRTEKQWRSIRGREIAMVLQDQPQPPQDGGQPNWGGHRHPPGAAGGGPPGQGAGVP